MHSIRIDNGQHLFVDGLKVCEHVTHREEQFLRVVMGHNGTASKDFILTAMYGGRDEPDIKIVDVFAAKIRRKMGPHRVAIETLWGKGYARNKDYEMVEADPSQAAVRVDAVLLNAVAYGCGEKPDDLVTRLLTAERERLWADDAAEVAEVA